MIRPFRFAPQKRTVVLLFSAGSGLIGVLAIIAMLAISAGIGATRTVVLEAQATGLTIHFSGQANDWALGQVTVCTPKQQIDLTVLRGSGDCDARRYVEDHRQDFRINWSQSSSALVTAPESGMLSIDILGQMDIADRTRVVIQPESWSTTGALTFSGDAQVGNQLASGETKMVLAGSFEVREKPLWSDNTEVLKAGLIRRGESASLTLNSASGEHTAEVFGHITPVETGKPGFSVGIVSVPGPVFLKLGFFGAAKPTQIAPSWIDRALTSPLILALAAVLSIILSVGQFVNSAASSFKRSFELKRDVIQADKSCEALRQTVASEIRNANATLGETNS